MSLSPWLKTPLTDLAGVVSNQWGDKCGKLELQAVECVEAYGIDKGLKACDVLLRDFRECVTGELQDRRLYAMYRERERQYKAGERQERYFPPPNTETF